MGEGWERGGGGVCEKREESEQGMLEVRKTRGLGEWGSGTEPRGRYLGKEN